MKGIVKTIISLIPIMILFCFLQVMQSDIYAISVNSTIRDGLQEDAYTDSSQTNGMACPVNDVYRLAYTDMAGTALVNYVGNGISLGVSSQRSAIKFNITGVTGTVTSAKLKIHVVDAVNNPVVNLISTADNSWTQTNQKFPAFNPANIINGYSNLAVSQNSDMTFTVTDYIQGLVDSSASNVSFVITGKESGDQFFNFVSNLETIQVGYRPALELTYIPTAASPLVTATAISTNSTIPTWNWTSGSGGNGTFRYKLDNNDFTSGATTTSLLSYTPGSALSEGPHTLYVQESNGAAPARWSNSGSFTINVDITPPAVPTVTGTTPTNSATPTWTWSSGGGGSGNYRYKLDDSDLTSGATLTSTAAYTPGSALSKGSHTLYVQERDSAGNWSNNGAFTIVINLTSLVSVSAAPAQGGTVTGAGTYNEGATVTITATPNSCYSFVNWTEGGSVVSTDASYTFTQGIENRTLTANFIQLTYTIASLSDQTMAALTSGYGTQETKSITITRTGTGDLVNLTAALSGADADKFTITHPAATTLSAVVPSTTFKVKAKDGLPAGTYTATVAISAENMTNVTFTVTQVVYPTYTVTFDFQSGSRVSIINGITSGSSIIVPAEPIRSGYTFGGWYKEPGCTNAWNFSTDTVTKDITLYAKWNHITHTVSASAITAEDGTVTGAGTYNEGATVTVTATANSGYSFVNWTEGGSVVSTDASYTFKLGTENRNLVANFIKLTYTIASLSDQTMAALTVGYGTQETKSITITRTGTGDIVNLFAALSGADAGNFTITQPTPAALSVVVPSTTFTVKAKDGLAAGTYTATVTISAENMTNVTFTVTQVVNPLPTYTVTFDSQSGSTVPAISVTSGSGISAPDIPTRSGYTFEGWYKESGCTNAWNFSTDTVTKDITLYAKWNHITHTISASAIMAEGGTVTGAGTYNEGETVTVTAAANSGYSFVNWTEGGRVVSTDASYTFKLGTENRNLIASFIKLTHTIAPLSDQTMTALTAGYGTQETKSITITRTGTGDLVNLTAALSGADAGNFTVTQPTATTLSAAVPSTTFTVEAKDWLPAGTYTATVTISAENMADVTFTVTQVVNPTYTVTFDFQSGGSVSIINGVTSGSSIIVPDIPTRSGYTFGGWYKEPGCTNAWNFSTDTVTKDITLYAKWNHITHTVSASAITAEGGTVTGAGTYNEGAAVTVTATPNSGYSFVSWTEGGSVVSTDALYTFTQGTEDRNLVANFIQLTYTIAPLSDQTMAALTVGYGTQETKNITITRTGNANLVNLTAALSGVDADKFTITQPTATTLSAVVPSAAFTVKAKDGLAAGNYTATVTISAENMTDVTFTVMQVVNLLPTYKVTFDSQSGSTVAAISVTSGSGISAPAAPTRSGYTFGGWYKESGCTNAWNFSANTVTKDIILYAKWTSAGSSTGGSSGGSTEGGSGSSGGGSSGGGGGPVPDTNPKSQVTVQVISSNGNAAKPITAIHDKTTGVLTIEVTSALLDSAFDKSAVNRHKVKTVVIDIPKISGVNVYETALPASFLTSGDASKGVEIKTDIATVTVPGNMLTRADAAGAQNVALSISAGDKSKLNAHVQAQIGNRPLIELNLTINGRKTEWRNRRAPVTVSIPYTPTEEELKHHEHITVWYIDGSGKAVAVPNGRYDPKTREVIFTVTHFSQYAIAFVQKAFSDLDSMAWAKEPIEVMASKGIINGTGEDTFSPELNITRADYVMLLVNTLDLDAEFDNNFDDVKPADYYYKAVGIAKKLGIALGSGSNKFNPRENISRQDMIALTASALEKFKNLETLQAPAVLNKFKDKEDIAGYAVDGMAALVRDGMLSGSGDKINPRAKTTRAEVGVFMYRIYNKYQAF